MNLITTRRCIELDDDGTEESLASVWFYDEAQDFVFPLSRQLHGDDADLIEFMVLDQMWDAISDCKCVVDIHTITADVPASLRQYTDGDSIISVKHGCIGQDFSNLLHVLGSIFEGKHGLVIDPSVGDPSL